MRKRIIRVLGYGFVLTILSLLISCAPKRDIDDARLFFEKNYESLMEMNEEVSSSEGFSMVHERMNNYIFKGLGIEDQKRYLWLSYGLRELKLRRVSFLDRKDLVRFSGDYIAYAFFITGFFDGKAYWIDIVYISSDVILNDKDKYIKGELIPLDKPNWFILYKTEF